MSRCMISFVFGFWIILNKFEKLSSKYLSSPPWIASGIWDKGTGGIWLIGISIGKSEQVKYTYSIQTGRTSDRSTGES